MEGQRTKTVKEEFEWIGKLTIAHRIELKERNFSGNHTTSRRTNRVDNCRKTDRTLRLCIDPKEFNMGKGNIFHNLHGKKFGGKMIDGSTLDASAGFW